MLLSSVVSKYSNYVKENASNEERGSPSHNQSPRKREIREILERNHLLSSPRKEREKEILALGRSPFYHTRSLAEAPGHEIFIHPQIHLHYVRAKAPFLVKRFIQKLKNKRLKSLSEAQQEFINDISSNNQTKNFRFKKKIDPVYEIEKSMTAKRIREAKLLSRSESHHSTIQRVQRFNIFNFQSKEAKNYIKRGRLSPKKKLHYRRRQKKIKILLHKISVQTQIFYYKMISFFLYFRPSFFKTIFKVWLPDDTLRIVWDVMGMVLILEELIMIPFLMAFTIDNSSNFENFNTFVTFYFITDILLNLNTAFYNKGSLIINRKAIVRNYLKSWFLMDLISSFPYEFLDFQGEDPEALQKMNTNSQEFQRKARILRVIRFLRFAKITRLLRILKLKNSLRKLEDYLQFNMTINTILECLKIVFTIFFLAHWCACFWYYVGVNETDNDEPVTWLSHLKMADGDLYDIYITCLYFAVTTMLTVGFGDVIPLTWTEQIFTMSIMFLGCGVFAYAMNSIGNIFQGKSHFSLETRKKLIQINLYMVNKEFPKELQARIRRHLEYIFEGEKNSKFSEKSFKDLLSINLREEMIMEVNKRFLVNSHFFQIKFSSNLFARIPFMMREKTFVPDEIIIYEEDLPKEQDIYLYFITLGKASVYIERTQTELINLEKEDMFGEVSFFSSNPRTASVKSVNFMSCFALSKSEFLRLLSTSFDKDKQYYNQIRDSIEIHKDYSLVSLMCSSCQELGHIAINCPKIHYVCDPQFVFLARKINEKKFQRSYKRRDKKYNSRMEQKKLIEIIFLYIWGGVYPSDSGSSYSESSPLKSSRASSRATSRQPTFDFKAGNHFENNSAEKMENLSQEKPQESLMELNLDAQPPDENPENIPEIDVTERFNALKRQKGTTLGEQMYKLNMEKKHFKVHRHHDKGLHFNRTTTFKNNNDKFDNEIKLELRHANSVNAKHPLKIKTDLKEINQWNAPMSPNNMETMSNINKHSFNQKSTKIQIPSLNNFKYQSSIEIGKIKDVGQIQNIFSNNAIFERHFEKVSIFSNYMCHNNIDQIMMEQNKFVQKREKIILEIIEKRNKKYEQEFKNITRKLASKKTRLYVSKNELEEQRNPDEENQENNEAIDSDSMSDRSNSQLGNENQKDSESSVEEEVIGSGNNNNNQRKDTSPMKRKTLLSQIKLYQKEKSAIETKLLSRKKEAKSNSIKKEVQSSSLRLKEKLKAVDGAAPPEKANYIDKINKLNKKI